jgi:glycosyltransferase involved in cell wall biosynthesis
MRKNILILGHSYATQFIDISNQYTKLFDKNKYNVTVAYLLGESHEEITQRHLAEEVIFLNFPPRAIRGLKVTAIKKMLSLQREKNFSIIIGHRYKPAYIMMWVAQFCQIPALFLVMHDLKTLHHLFRKITVAFLWRKNMFFVGVSNAVRDDMRRDIWRVPMDNVITLYNMLDVELTEPALLSRDEARKKLHLAADDFVFGTIGRLVKAKDQHTLIRAFAQIKPQCPRAKIIILGDGELEQELKNLCVTLSVENSVIFAGFVPQAFTLTKAFDVFVLSSIREAFGRVLLEAMIAKVPVIAAKTDGIPEVLGNTGVLLDAGNVTQWAEYLLSAYNTPANTLAKTGMDCYRRVVNEFSLQRFKEIFWQLPILKGFL